MSELSQKPTVTVIVEALRKGLTADIWYDAHDHDDKPAEALIEATKDAMDLAARQLIIMEVALQEMGVNVASLLTDKCALNANMPKGVCD